MDTQSFDFKESRAAVRGRVTSRMFCCGHECLKEGLATVRGEKTMYMYCYEHAEFWSKKRPRKWKEKIYLDTYCYGHAEFWSKRRPHSCERRAKLCIRIVMDTQSFDLKESRTAVRGRITSHMRCCGHTEFWSKRRPRSCERRKNYVHVLLWAYRVLI